MIVKRVMNKALFYLTKYIPTEVMEAVLWDRRGGKEIESYSYHSSTQCFANECIQKFSGDIHLLSMAGKVEHIVAMIPFCEELVHISMIPMEDDYELKKKGGG